MAINQFTYMIGAPDGSDLGPFTFEQLKKKIADGEVKADTFVKRSDGDTWSTASEFSECRLRHVAIDPHGQKSAMLEASEEMGNMVYARTIRKASGVFFWIGAYSVLNATLAFFGAGIGYALGFQIAFLLGNVGRTFESSGAWLVFLVNLALSFMFLGLGVASWHSRYLPFLIGCALYLGDFFLSMYLVNWVAIIVHFIALLFLYEGVEAFLEWREQPAKSLVPLGLPVSLATGLCGIALAYFFSSQEPSFDKNWMAQEPALQAKAAWVQEDTKSWPQILLTHEAEFDGYGQLEGASAFLMEMRDGEVIGVTAKHLIGYAGGLPGLKLIDVNQSLVYWKLYARGVPNPALSVSGILGNLRGYRIFNDVIALELEPYSEELPFTPLRFRSSQVTAGEKIFVIGVPYGDEAPQRVYPGKITEVDLNLLDGRLEEKVDMSGFSGAPVVDAKGFVVAVVTGPASLTNPEKERGFTSHSILELGHALPAPDTAELGAE